MFVIKNKADFREYLGIMVKQQEDCRKRTKTVKEQHFQDGVIYGLRLAQDGLDDWDQSEFLDLHNPPV